LATKKKCFEGIDVGGCHRSKDNKIIINFKSVDAMLLETLSGGLNLSISDVHWTPLF